jgi:pimeloyl-ACP methyl ester carboxylesterase
MNTYEIIEENVIIKGQYNLVGTIAMPKRDEEKLPAVLLISGSGHINRDGYVAPMKLDTHLYKEVAHLITSLGYISLRIDKRGVGMSEGNYIETGMWDLVEDVERAVDFLKQQPHVDREKIVLLGHSEGCILATAVNARTSVDGMILLAGGGETVEEALKRQREILIEELKNKNRLNKFIVRICNTENKIEAQAEKFKRKVMNSDKAMMRYKFSKVHAKWFKEHYQYHLLQDLEKVTCPVLAITGDKDFQADSKKLQRLHHLVKGTLESHVIKDMNHGLKKHEGPMSAINFKKEYKEKAHDPLHSDAVHILSSWLHTHYPIE